MDIKRYYAKILIPVFIIFPFLFSGCISTKLKSDPTLIGDLFREESNAGLPQDVLEMTKKRRLAYHDANQVDYYLIKDRYHAPQKEYESILDLRWELIRVNRQNEARLEELKDILRTCASQETQTVAFAEEGKDRGELIDEKIEELECYNKEFIKIYDRLRVKIKPYRRPLYAYFI